MDINEKKNVSWYFEHFLGLKMEEKLIDNLRCYKNRRRHISCLLAAVKPREMSQCLTLITRETKGTYSSLEPRCTINN